MMLNIWLMRSTNFKLECDLVLLYKYRRLIKREYCYSSNQVNYLVLLLKMPGGSPTISRAPSVRDKWLGGRSL